MNALCRKITQSCFQSRVKRSHHDSPLIFCYESQRWYEFIQHHGIIVGVESHCAGKSKKRCLNHTFWYIAYSSLLDIQIPYLKNMVEPGETAMVSVVVWRLNPEPLLLNIRNIWWQSPDSWEKSPTDNSFPIFWSVTSTHLKNMSHLESSSQIELTIDNCRTYFKPSTNLHVGPWNLQFLSVARLLVHRCHDFSEVCAVQQGLTPIVGPIVSVSLWVFSVNL